MVERTLIRPPESQIGPISKPQRQTLMAGSLVAGIYEQAVDRQSAHEILNERAAKQAAEVEQARQKEIAKAEKRTGSGRQTVLESFFKSAARSVGSTIGRQIIRGVLGSIMGGRR
jgi:hypothetical protein